MNTIVYVSLLFMMQFEPQANWDLDRDLYERMKADASLISENADMYAFYNDREASNFKDFYLVKEQLKEINSFNSIQNTITLIDSFINLNMIEIMNNDSLRRTGLYVDSVLFNANLVLHHLTDSLIVINDSLHTLILNTRNENVEDIRANNQEITTSEQFEENERLVNEVVLATVEKGIYGLDSAQRQILENLIFQCPVAGGRSVYIARSLYRMANDTLTYNDDSICKAQAISWRVSNPKVETPKTNSLDKWNVFVYPNPAKTEVIFKLNKGLEEASQILIYNNVGQITNKYLLKSGEKTFNIGLNSYPSGVYYFQIVNEKGIIASAKFVVEK